jgi:tripartite-type tricarboxylate transporter receptor subunit TctC
MGHVLPKRYQRPPPVRAYRGAAPATNDLVAGHIDLMINDSVNFLPYLRAGAIKAFLYARSV